jgi:tetratricopeptide (TPR) repeat protein
MNDTIDEARALATASEERGRELGKYLAAEIGEIESLAGNHDAAAERYGLLYDWEVAHGLAGAGFSALVRGRELCLAGRHDDAERCLAEARTYVALDLLEHAVGLQAEALVAAHRRDHAAAERFGREALTYIHETDSLKFQGDAYCDLAEVLESAGRRDEAVAAWQEALDRYERKGVIPLVRRTRERLASLEPA